MFNPARAFLLSLMIVAVLAFSVVGTTVVYADGGTTTPEAPPEEVATEPPVATEEPGTDTVTVDTIDTSEPVWEEVGPTKVPSEETPVPTEEVVPPPVEETATPVPTEEVFLPEVIPTKIVPPDTIPSETTPPAETPILDTVPDDTTVAVLNAQGELQPLATQAAADAIATSDPIWCPAGQAPTPGQNGCTQSFTSFTALLTFLSGNAAYTGAGTIYVQQGNYQGNESTIDFNNFDLSNISGADLTITGGWNTSTGTVDSTSSFNGVSLIIGNTTNPWGGTLTLNNLVFSNPSQTGISLNTQGDINLTNVSVTNSTNGAGAELNSGGNVTVEKSKFERNKTAGAIIRAVGDVAISMSSFSNPANARRQIVGLDIISDGSVSLFQVLANENRQAGATIDAAGRVTIVQSEFSGTKIILNNEFLGYGLTVVSQDAIDLDTVTANDNFLWGAMLTAAGDVTIANSVFNANTTESPGFIDDTGLLVDSGGNVFIANSHADDNRLIGATIKAVGDVAIQNSTFSSNNGVILDSANNPTFYGYGLNVITGGSISLNGVVASGNTLFGAHLEAGGDVNVAGSDFSNQTSGSNTDQTGRGLEIISTNGNVFLSNVTLNNNQTFGADITAGGDVFLNAVTATNNGTTGVTVETACKTLFVIGGTYSNNGQYGLSVLSSALTQTTPPVFAGNGVGNIFEDPGTCVFTPPTPPDPPVYQPNDLGAVVPDVPDNDTLGQNLKYSSDAIRGLFTASASPHSGQNRMSLNGFLAVHRLAPSNTHIGVFSGMYAYVYLSSGMQIVLYSPGSLNELVMKR